MKKDNKTLYLIEYKMKWTQAQSYCRYNYTDLASGLDQVDEEKYEAVIKGLIPDKKFSAWVGLFRDSWRWSDGSDFSFRYWDMELFIDTQSNKTCAMTLLNRSGKWSSDECDKEKPFFCYDGEFYNNLILIKENKTWEEALYYCRENYNDLVSITNSHDQNWIQEKVKQANSPYVWLGLRYTCTLGFWFWVTDEVVEYKNWASDVTADDCDMSGAMNRGSPHKWSKQADNKMFNFICSKK
uniref:C-type lectin domain-containing protein n=1 Tax=Oreochromis niloticus TaxID=8128 RepID=A0A669DIS0_ORENI